MIMKMNALFKLEIQSINAGLNKKITKLLSIQ